MDVNHADFEDLVKALFLGPNVATSLLDFVYSSLYEFIEITMNYTGQYHKGAKKAVWSNTYCTQHSQLTKGNV